jgi:hypothetical protein
MHTIWKKVWQRKVCYLRAHAIASFSEMTLREDMMALGATQGTGNF